MEIIKYPIRLGQATSEGDTMTGKTRREKIFALVAKWNDDDRIPVSFDDWQPVVIEQNDLESWVSFNITDYLDWCVANRNWHGFNFNDEEIVTMKEILKETEKIMSMEEEASQ